MPLRRLTHLHLNSNFNPSRTTNRAATKTWADLSYFLPRLPERLQTLTFGSLGRSEQFFSVEQSLVWCTAQKSERKDHRRTSSSSKHGSRHSRSSHSTKKWWHVEVPYVLNERIKMLAKWGSPLLLDEVYLYK